jgi:NAD(P)-dependent dehydrogenase (short-subunit alcohol dehydrogenase family)
MGSASDLTGKVAVITGADGAIGRATAALLAQRGASIVAVDRPQVDLSGYGRHLPAGATLATASADVTDEAAVAAYARKALDAFGRIDIFFNNAGVEGLVSPIEDYPLAVFRQVIDVNVVGVFLGLKHMLPVMYAQGSGCVVNTSSVAGLKGSPGLSAYNASKHAVVGLTRAAAAEAGPRGVRVVSVNPGPIESRMMASINTGQATDAAAAHAATVARIPQRRYGTAGEVAELVAFLASDAASFCNGGTYSVDGGLSAV